MKYIAHASALVLAGSVLMGCSPDNGAENSVQQAGQQQASQEAATQQLSVADYQRAEQMLYTNKDKYIRNDSVTPNWIGAEDSFWYSRKNATGGTQFVRVNAATGEKSAAFDQAAIAAELTRLTEEEVTADALPFAAFAYIDSGIAFTAAGKSYQCAENKCEASNLPAPAVKPGETPSPDGKWAVYFKDNNLWIRALDGSADYALTTDGEADNTYGISTGTDLNPITRQRLGMVDAPLVMFSPDGSKLLTQRIDQRQVEVMHLVHHTPQDGSLRPKGYSWRYATALDEHKPMASFALFDLNSKARVDVDYPAMPLVFIPHVHPLVATETRWQPDGQAFYFVHRYDFGKGYAINRVDVTTGQVQTMAERKAEATAFPAISVAMAGVVQPVADNGVIWYSDESNWGHLYFSTIDGKIQQLTQGDWNVRDIVRFDEENGVVYFNRNQAESEGNPYHTLLSSVRLDGSEFKTLTQDDAVHVVRAQNFSPSGNYFVDNFSSATVPGISQLRDNSGKLIAELEKADISALEEIGVIAPETFQVTAADGKTKIWGRLLKPSNFDPTKSYPVVDTIYPGPQSNRVSHAYTGMSSGGLFDRHSNPQSLAELGFIVIAVDGRGTPGRSRAFHYDTENSLLGDAGGLVDHIAAIKELAETRPWMDLDKVGIYGHSGGGYASTHALLEHPDFFKVAVSSAGNHEQRIYIPTWGESYLGDEKGDNYLLASNPHLASNLEGKLFIIVGNMDDNVHPAQSYQVVDALIKANKDFDLLVLPNAPHSYGVFGNTEQDYSIRRRWDYFVENLMGAEPPANYQIGAMEKSK